jgi:hypothetical protein
MTGVPHHHTTTEETSADRPWQAVGQDAAALPPWRLLTTSIRRRRCAITFIDRYGDHAPTDTRTRPPHQRHAQGPRSN